MKKTLTLRLIFSFFLFICFVDSVNASDNCATATPISSNTSCSTTSGNTSSGYTNSGLGCTTGNSDDDIWYVFTAIETSHTITVNGGADFDAVLAVYTSCGGGSPTGGTCVDATGTDGNETRNLTGLTVGNTYYIKVHDYQAGGGSFTICVTHVSTAPPPNDACSNAINLPCGTSNLAGTTAYSVSETHGTGCSSSNYGVWYSFAGDGYNTTVTISGGSLDAMLSISSGNCTTKTNIACVDNGAAGATESYTFGTVIGTTYYVYVAYWQAGTTTGTFNISRTCVIPPSNDECVNATPLPCGTSNLAGTTVNTISETHGTGCTPSNYGVWYTFTGDGQSTTITTSGGTLDVEISVVSGSCASKTNVGCVDVNGAGETDTYTFTTVGGVNYGVYIAYYTSGTTTGTFNISRSCVPAPSPPSNDACSAATNLPCGTSNLAGTTVNSAIETAVPTCSMSQYGVWYSFTGDGQITTISTVGTGGSAFDQEMAVFSGTCGSLTNMTCQDANGSGGTETFTFTTANGATYYVYVGYYGTGANTGTFTISRTCVAGPAAPGNDACANATALPCGTSNLAGTTVGTSYEVIPGCLNYVSNYGVWYNFTGDGSQVTISTATTAFDAGMAIFSGTCASKTQLYCRDDSGASGTESATFTTTNGTNYLVYVAYFTTPNTNTGAFNISNNNCVAMSPCGNPATNDYCSSPATLTEGPGTFSATTDGTFTADQTQIESGIGSGLFCGSIENNSWYIFTANTTTETFPIASVTGCAANQGIQGQVFQIGRDGNQCCTSFTSMSNCYNPGTTALGTITATGLTIGASYVLMIDGYAGDGCDFTISNWTATGILPVEMTSFTGTPEEFGNLLRWTTASEINNDYFTVRHSRDGINYTEIGQMDGSGSSNSYKNYSFIHNEAKEGINFYQLEQVDFNGFKKASEVVKVNRFDYAEVSIKIYPNPTQDNAFFEYYSNDDRNIKYKLIDCIGNVIEVNSAFIEKGTSIFPIQLSQLPSGIYLLEIESTDKVNTFKIIKN